MLAPGASLLSRASTCSISAQRFLRDPLARNPIPKARSVPAGIILGRDGGDEALDAGRGEAEHLGCGIGNRAPSRRAQRRELDRPSRAWCHALLRFPALPQRHDFRGTGSSPVFKDIERHHRLG